MSQLFRSRGYRGPISFDLKRNGNDEYDFIYDCNPRLTAIYPIMTVLSALRERCVQSMVNIDYRGIFTITDIDNCLTMLQAQALLYTHLCNSGVILLPNLCRLHGYDLLMVNMSKSQMNKFIESGILGVAQNQDKGMLTNIYY